MTERVDYRVGPTFDFDFSTGKYSEIEDGDVVVQDAVIILAEETQPLVGEQITATKLSRYRRLTKSEFRDHDGIESFQFYNFVVDGNELTFNVDINGTNIQDTITLI